MTVRRRVLPRVRPLVVAGLIAVIVLLGGIWLWFRD
jgi:hypothetical protein